MATTTTNLGLTKPSGTDKIRIAQINGNMDILDDKIGAVGNTSLQAQVTSANQAITNVQNGLAYIVGNTNTTGSILVVDQFVYVKGHSTIAEGLYKVTADIAANGSIATSNTSACSEGGLNALNSKTSPKLVSSVPFQNGMYYCTAEQTIGGVTIPAYTMYNVHIYQHDATVIAVSMTSSKAFSIMGTNSFTKCEELALKSNFTKITFSATSSNSVVDISSQVSSDKFIISAVCASGNMVSLPFRDNSGNWFLFIRGTASWQTLADQSRSFTVVYMG